MLKIKDNVDLKELEKFGFEYSKMMDWHKENFNMTISLGDNRAINTTCDDYYYDKDIYECIEWIYDLIEAGLVEKVEE